MGPFQSATAKPSQRGEPHPVDRLVPYAADMAAQHRVLVPEHQQFSSLHLVTAEHQDSRAEYPPRQEVEDLEQHPASQPSPHKPRRRNGQVSDAIQFPGGPANGSHAPKHGRDVPAT